MVFLAGGRAVGTLAGLSELGVVDSRQASPGGICSLGIPPLRGKGWVGLPTLVQCEMQSGFLVALVAFHGARLFELGSRSGGSLSRSELRSTPPAATSPS